MGHLFQLWDLDYDPTDASNPRGIYVPYDFTSVGRPGIAKGSMTRDWARRESVVSVPGLDGVLDANARAAGPMDRADVTFAFTVWTDGDNDAAEDLLRAQVAPGVPQRLVYKTDSGALWFTVGSNPRIKQTSAAENNWGGGGECNFSVTWRIRPYWTPRFSEAAEVFHTGSTFATGSVFGSVGSTTITSANQSFTVDATGTAGSTLPTLPDSGARFTFVGPLGGSLGFQVVNGSSRVRDTSGALQSRSFTVPFQLLTPSDGATVFLDTQTFQINGVAFRPAKPRDASGYSYQREYFQVEPGIVNVCAVVALGTVTTRTSQTLTASGPLTAGVYTIATGGNTSPAIAWSDPASTVTAKLAAATPSPIRYTAAGGPLTTPLPITLTAIDAGFQPAVVVTPTGIVGGTIAARIVGSSVKTDFYRKRV